MINASKMTFNSDFQASAITKAAAESGIPQNVLDANRNLSFD